MKTTGELEIWARRMALLFLVGTVVSMAIVSAWVPFLGRDIEPRWFTWPNIAFLAPIPLMTAFTAWRIYQSIEWGGNFGRSSWRSRCSCWAFSGSGQPVPVQGAAGADDLASPTSSSAQMFALVGLPSCCRSLSLYTAYAYYVFRGKVAEDVQSSGYH